MARSCQRFDRVATLPLVRVTEESGFLVEVGSRPSSLTRPERLLLAAAATPAAFASPRKGAVLVASKCCDCLGGVRGAELYGQSGQSSKPQIVAPGEMPRRQLQIIQPAHNRLEDFLSFHARQRRAEAEMSSISKSEMAVIRA